MNGGQDIMAVQEFIGNLVGMMYCLQNLQLPIRLRSRVSTFYAASTP